jgi:hypothetical protein
MRQRSDEGAPAAATGPLSAEELRQMHAYWQAANYLSVGQIYLMDNPLLKEPLLSKPTSMPTSFAIRKSCECLHCRAVTRRNKLTPGYGTITG